MLCSMDSYIDVLCGLLMGIFSADSLVSGKDWCQVKLFIILGLRIADSSNYVHVCI